MATEDRWHDFAKEKPSEYMEGRNFIVSNGHYEKIATWCGYWENEPFMGDRLCDEVVSWKFYFTPEEEKANEPKSKELKSVYIDRTGDWCRSGNNTGKFYLKSEADEVIDEKDKEIEKYKTKYMELAKDHDHAVQACCDANKEIESLKASHYAEMVDAGMRERRISRALWLARAWFCGRSSEYFSGMASRCKIGQEDFYREVSERARRYMKSSYKCQAKAEEYK